jgi:hypothetical protein
MLPGMRRLVSILVSSTLLLLGSPTAANAAVQPGWRLRWAPDAARDGLAAFEHAEDDRANSDPGRAPHISVDGDADAYRFVMHLEDRDTSTDRQRHEVRGMRNGDQTVSMLYGDAWRFTYSMFIPDTLKATTTFSHIMQMKEPGTGSSPIIVQSLRRTAGRPTLELRVFDSDTLVGAVDLPPLQNHWIDIDFQIGIGDAPDGWVRWIVKDGATTVIDAFAGGVDTWLGDRVRPKWGIYRSIRDTSGSLQDTWMLIRNLRAYQWTEHDTRRSTARYEAEGATIEGGTVESGFDGPKPTGYVTFPEQPGGSVEWTVYAPAAGPAALNIWYANATPVARPMDVTVNGVRVAENLSFDRTPAWNDWETRTLVSPLHAGLNTVRVTATTARGAPHLDAIEVYQPVTVS